MNEDRRKAMAKLAKWSTPVVATVILPVHAQTTAVEPIGEIDDNTPRVPVAVVEPELECHDCEGVELPWEEPQCQGWRTEGGECVPENPSPEPIEPAMCSDKPHKTEICHHPKKGEPHEICVANSSVDKHISQHGDNVGKCDTISSCLGTGCAGQPL